MGIPPFFKGSVTRCRLRFAATFLFWTYCISQGMVRVCPFANLLIGPWLEFDPSAIEQFWLHAERFTDALGDDLFLHGNLLFIGHLSFIGGEVFSSISVGSQTSFFSRWLCKFVESFSDQVWFTSCIFGFSLMGTITFFRTLQPGSEILPWRQTSKRSLVSIASHVSQLTQGVSRLWVSTGLSTSGEQLTASSF